VGGYGQEWEAEQARVLAAHVARTAARLEALASRYAELRAMLEDGPGMRPAVDGGPVRRSSGPRVPLRVEVLDTLGEIDRFLVELLPLVRGTLRLGPLPKRTPVRAVRARSGLLFIAGALAGVYAEDPVLGDDVARGAWQLERRAGWIFGDRSRPFALTEACGACGMPALWVVPERMLIVCGNPACRASRPVHAALPVYVSEGVD
jgi:hypothetical protein